MKIPYDSTERAFHTNSNGLRTKREHRTHLEIHHGQNLVMRMTKSDLSRKPDNKPTTKWPPHYWHPTTQFSTDLFEQDWFKTPVNYNYPYNTGIDIPKHDTRFDDFELKPYIPPTPPTMSTNTIAYRALGAVMSSILVMIVITACRRNNNRSRRGVVLLPAAGAGTVVVGAATVRPGIATNRPSGQGGLPQVPTSHNSTSQPSGAVPPTSDLPPSYSECINMNARAPPLCTNRDTEPVHNGLLDIGFRNGCVAMTTTPNNSKDGKSELVFDNGRIVERSAKI